MEDKKELILIRIKELFKEYQEECENRIYKRYEYDYKDKLEFVLKVLLDIYTYDDEAEEEHRYIYHDWDLCEFVIEELVSGNLK